MLVKTKFFGEVDLDEQKVLKFENGILGFEKYKRWTILYDVEKSAKTISWFQCVDNQNIALPVIEPFAIKPDYNPTVNDELLAPLGEFKDEEIVVLVTMTVPTDVKAATANLKAPLIINSENRKGVQIVAENTDYPVKFSVYEAIQKLKKEKGVE